MSTSVKCGGCKDKSWRKCCDKCLDSLFECYICKGECYYNEPSLYIIVLCVMKMNTSADLYLKNLSVDYLFIYIDIDIHIPRIDSRNMLKDLT